MRRPARTLLALSAAAALAAAGCDRADRDPGRPEPPEGDPPAAEAEDADERVVAVYFSNPDRGDDVEVFALERTVTGPGVLRGALEALLAGPTAEEAAAGYTSWFSAETSGLLVSVTIEDGTAHVDLDARLRERIPNASTSTGSTILLAQLDETVTQFASVDAVIYALDGDVDAFYHWLQRVSPLE